MEEYNIVLLKPLSSKMRRLKANLDSDERYSLYEVDSIDEYFQIVAILDECISVFPDFSSFNKCLAKNEKEIKKMNNQAFLYSDRSVPAFLIEKMILNGLNGDLNFFESSAKVKEKIDAYFLEGEVIETSKKEEKIPVLEKNKRPFEGLKNSSYMSVQKGLSSAASDLKTTKLSFVEKKSKNYHATLSLDINKYKKNTKKKNNISFLDKEQRSSRHYDITQNLNNKLKRFFDGEIDPKEQEKFNSLGKDEMYLQDYFYPSYAVLIVFFHMVRLKNDKEKAKNFLLFVLKAKFHTTLEISKDSNEPSMEWNNGEEVSEFIMKSEEETWTFKTELPSSKKNILISFFMLGKKLLEE